MYTGPPLRFTIEAVDNSRQLSMPTATSEDEAEMREEFKKICRKMPHLHVALYDGTTLIDERQPNASRH
ncbi:MAG: hypothetical protein E5Y10_28905 [Mesorhizobium sp.]|nr:MAG: hypothetical protein E5Y13_25755 [Mesorhizobium sp.]TJU84572.1 MAG: hypothetical protein E5Y10_28905 [Mesorhizobium sp.]